MKQFFTCPEIPYFGAKYPDARCIDGYLWDLDSDEEGKGLTKGGEVPCPFCNMGKFREMRYSELNIEPRGDQDRAERTKVLNDLWNFRRKHGIITFQIRYKERSGGASYEYVDSDEQHIKKAVIAKANDVLEKKMRDNERRGSSIFFQPYWPHKRLEAVEIEYSLKDSQTVKKRGGLTVSLALNTVTINRSHTQMWYSVVE